MKEKENFLDKAADALVQTPVPPGPPQQTIDSTIAKLNEISSSIPPATSRRYLQILERLKAAKNLTRIAAAAVVLIAVGYIAGRASAPEPPDIQQLCSTLEPAIREELLDEMKQHWQLSAAATYAQLKDELAHQYRQDLSRFAAQILAASTAVTNQSLEDLIAAINAAQTQDRRWVTAALQQIESSRLQDKNQLADGLATLAVYTDDQLLRTKYDIAKLLSNPQANTIRPNASETQN
jgi:3-dehydroquinate synthase class II